MLRWFKRFYRSKENLSKNEIDEMMENNDNIQIKLNDNEPSTVAMLNQMAGLK